MEPEHVEPQGTTVRTQNGHRSQPVGNLIDDNYPSGIIEKKLKNS